MATAPVAAPAFRLLDPKFRQNASRYVGQCAAATLTMFMVLSVLDAFSQTVLVASLGASVFIAFSMPHVEAARPRYLLGGYLVGTLVGCSASLATGLLAEIGLFESATRHIAAGAVATGLAIFVMVVTDTEHPPAAALALGFALNDWNLATIAVVWSGIVAISTLKELGKGCMINLL